MVSDKKVKLLQHPLQPIWCLHLVAHGPEHTSKPLLLLLLCWSEKLEAPQLFQQLVVVTVQSCMQYSMQAYTSQQVV